MRAFDYNETSNDGVGGLSTIIVFTYALLMSIALLIPSLFLDRLFWNSARISTEKPIVVSVIFPLAYTGLWKLFYNVVPFGSWGHPSVAAVQWLDLLQLASLFGGDGILFLMAWTGPALFAGFAQRVDTAKQYIKSEVCDGDVVAEVGQNEDRGNRVLAIGESTRTLEFVGDNVEGGDSELRSGNGDENLKNPDAVVVVDQETSDNNNAPGNQDQQQQATSNIFSNFWKLVMKPIPPSQQHQPQYYLLLSPFQTFLSNIQTPLGCYLLIFTIVLIYGGFRSGYWGVGMGSLGNGYQKNVGGESPAHWRFGCLTIDENQYGYNFALNKTVELIRQSGVKFVVWSEGAVTIKNEQELFNDVSIVAQNNSVYIATSYLLVDNFNNPDTSYKNIMSLFDSTGTLILRYEKSHPVPMLESTLQPGPKILQTVDVPSLSNLDPTFDPSRSQYGYPTLTRIGVGICFDLSTFPQFVESAGRSNVDLLIHPASMWGTIGIADFDNMILRTVENGVTLVNCANLGVSGVVGPNGQVYSGELGHENFDSFVADVPVFFGGHVRLNDSDITPNNSALLSANGADYLYEQQQSQQRSSTAKDDTPKQLESNQSNEGPSMLFPKRQTNLIFVSLCIAIFIAAVDVSLVATALPDIMADLGKLEMYSWIASGYLLTYAGFMPVSGKISEVFGRRPTFLFAVITFMVGSALCGASNSMEMLIASRAVQGIGAGGILSLVTIITSDLVSLRDRGKYQGLLGAAIGLGTVSGPLLGGVFTDHLSWRWGFYVNIPLGLLTLPVVIMYMSIPTPPGSMITKAKRIDWLGSIVIMIATSFLLVGLNWGGSTYGWKSVQVLGMLGGSFLGYILFAVVEVWVAVDPIIPVKLLFTNRNFVSGSLLHMFYGAAFYTAVFYLPLEFQIVHGDSATMAGVRNLPLMVGLVLGSIISGRISTRLGRFVGVIQVGLALACGTTFLVALWDRNVPLWQEIVEQLIAGYGVGHVMQNIVLAIQASVSTSQMPTATAATNFFRSIGGVIGVSLANTLLNNMWMTEIMNVLGPDLAAKIMTNGTDEITIPEIKTYPKFFQDAIVIAFLRCIKLIWYMVGSFFGVSFLFGLFMRHVALRKSIIGDDVGITSRQVNLRPGTEDNSSNLEGGHQVKKDDKGQYKRVSWNSSTGFDQNISREGSPIYENSYNSMSPILQSTLDSNIYNGISTSPSEFQHQAHAGTGLLMPNPVHYHPGLAQSLENQQFQANNGLTLAVPIVAPPRRTSGRSTPTSPSSESHSPTSSWNIIASATSTSDSSGSDGKPVPPPRRIASPSSDKPLSPISPRLSPALQPITVCDLPDSLSRRASPNRGQLHLEESNHGTFGPFETPNPSFGLAKVVSKDSLAESIHVQVLTLDRNGGCTVVDRENVQLVAERSPEESNVDVEANNVSRVVVESPRSSCEFVEVALLNEERRN
ncbi:hypothetical protein HDU76_003938 [Blyttiomyces sp. JEL0837]|nr:hypothetical protein HDU76_003938 [Blyttiomyces sp. JEL0837]